MIRTLTLLLLLLTAAPAAAHTFTFPITLTDYWPNLEKMDAGWKLEGTGNFRWQFFRTGPGSFKLTNGLPELRCIEDHYTIATEDLIHGQAIDDDARINGGIYLTHSWADCPDGSFNFRQHYVPNQHFLWRMWEPGFGTLADQQRNYKWFLTPGGASAFFQVVDMNIYTLPTIEPDGIHHSFVQFWFDLATGDSRGAAHEHFYFGDVPHCDDGTKTSTGLTRYKDTDPFTGLVKGDVRFCWRKPATEPRS